MRNGSDIEVLVRRLEERVSGPRWLYLLYIFNGFLMIFLAATQARGYLNDVWAFLNHPNSGSDAAYQFSGLEPTWSDAGLVSALIGVGAMNIAVGFIALKARDVEALVVHLCKERRKAEQGNVP